MAEEMVRRFLAKKKQKELITRSTQTGDPYEFMFILIKLKQCACTLAIHIRIMLFVFISVITKSIS